MQENNAEAGREVVRIMEICREVEICTSEIYYHFAECFKEMPDMARTWKKTALEEENHARQFLMAINLRKHDLVYSVGLDLETAEAMLERVRTVLAEVKQSRPSVVGALRTAIALEEDLAGYHMSVVARFKEKSHKSLFEAMMNNDRDHVQELSRVYEAVVAGQGA
jgi:rubrerythrin